MRIVVTGAAGFIGSHLCESLLDRGHEVVGIDCFTDYYDRSAKESNIAAAVAQQRFDLVEADLRTVALEPILEGADAVVNQAATPGLVLGWSDFDTYLSCNVGAVQRLADACAATGVGHFVQASTSSVYGADATGDEGSATRPVSPYGVTKLAAEHLLGAHAATGGLPVTILRYFSVYGPRQRPDMAYRAFCESLLRGEPVTVYGDGSQSRSNTYVDDCVSATIAALERPGRGEVFNIGGGREITLLEALAVIADTLGVVAEVRFGARRRGDQDRTFADVRRAREVLGWEPLVNPAEGLAREASWVAATR